MRNRWSSDADPHSPSDPDTTSNQDGYRYCDADDQSHTHANLQSDENLNADAHFDRLPAADDNPNADSNVDCFPPANPNRNTDTSCRCVSGRTA